MRTFGRIPSLRELRMALSGFGIQEAPVLTQSYIPPGAMYASFPGFEGKWNVYAMNRPIGTMEFWSEGGQLKGKFSFASDPLLDIISSYVLSWRKIPIPSFESEIPMSNLNVDFNANKITFRLLGRPYRMDQNEIWGLFLGEASIAANQIIGSLTLYGILTGSASPRAEEPYVTENPGEPRYRAYKNLLFTVIAPEFTNSPFLIQHFVGGYDLEYQVLLGAYQYYIINFNAIKEMAPAFTPALVVVRSPTPGVTMEVTVPVVTLPEKTEEVKQELPTPEPTPQPTSVNPQPTVAETVPEEPIVEIKPKEELVSPPPTPLAAGFPKWAWLLLLGIGAFILFKPKKAQEILKVKPKRRKKEV